MTAKNGNCIIYSEGEGCNIFGKTMLKIFKLKTCDRCKRTLCADDTRQIFLEYLSGDALCAIQKDYFVRSLCPDCSKELLLWLDDKRERGSK